MPAAFFITKLNISVRWKIIPNGKYRTASTAIQVLCESACRLRCRFLYEVSILEQINQMLTGKTEIGVANAPLTQESRFDTIYTKQERLVAVMHKDNPWLPADDKALLLAHMEDMPICLSRGCSTLFLNVCSDSMIFPQILSINSTKLSTIAWAKENAGIGFTG